MGNLGKHKIGEIQWFRPNMHVSCALALAGSASPRYYRWQRTSLTGFVEVLLYSAQIIAFCLR